MQGTTLTGSWTIHHWLEEKSCRAADTLGKVVSSSGISFLISLRLVAEHLCALPGFNNRDLSLVKLAIWSLG